MWLAFLSMISFVDLRIDRDRVRPLRADDARVRTAPNGDRARELDLDHHHRAPGCGFQRQHRSCPRDLERCSTTVDWATYLSPAPTRAPLARALRAMMMKTVGRWPMRQCGA